LVAALCAVLSGLSVASSAAAFEAGTITKSSGATSATLSWKAGKDGVGVSDPHLTISRSGATVFNQSIADVCGLGCVLVADSPEYADESVLKVADLDGDGEPEVLVDTFSGGAHCCISTRVYSYRPASVSYTRDPTFQWLDASYKLEDLDADGRPELVGFDASFSYAFASYAGSEFPPLVQSFRRNAASGKGSFTNVTRRFPALIRTHAAQMLTLIRKARPSKVYEIQGAVAAYVADEYLLGHGSVGRAEMSRDRRRRLVHKGFSAEVLKFLKHAGYR
jgi:hypothetical protein